MGTVSFRFPNCNKDVTLLAACALNRGASRPPVTVVPFQNSFQCLEAASPRCYVPDRECYSPEWSRGLSFSSTMMMATRSSIPPLMLLVTGIIPLPTFLVIESDVDIRGRDRPYSRSTWNPSTETVSVQVPGASPLIVTVPRASVTSVLGAMAVRAWSQRWLPESVTRWCR